MSRVLVYLGRFALILVGYAIASLAASAFLHVVFARLAGLREPDVMPAVVMGSLVFSIPFVALFVAYFAFLPAIPAILLAEMLGKRDWLFYATRRRGAWRCVDRRLRPPIASGRPATASDDPHSRSAVCRLR